MYQHFHETEMYELAVVMYRAVNKPEEIKKMEPGRRMASEINMEELPAMLRIPKKVHG